MCTFLNSLYDKLIYFQTFQGPSYTLFNLHVETHTSLNMRGISIYKYRWERGSTFACWPTLLQCNRLFSPSPMLPCKQQSQCTPAHTKQSRGRCYVTVSEGKRSILLLTQTWCFLQSKTLKWIELILMFGELKSETCWQMSSGVIWLKTIWHITLHPAVLNR